MQQLQILKTTVTVFKMCVFKTNKSSSLEKVCIKVTFVDKDYTFSLSKLTNQVC